MSIMDVGSRYASTKIVSDCETRRELVCPPFRSFYEITGGSIFL